MNWLVVASKPQQESRAEVNLRRQSMEVYCPRIQFKATMRALFPRYLFVRINGSGDQPRLIRNSYGVHSLVSFGLEPATVTDNQIGEIKSREYPTKPGVVKLCPYKSGESVMWGLVPAIFEEMVDDDRCRVLFSMLGKANHKVLSISQLQPAN